MKKYFTYLSVLLFLSSCGVLSNYKPEKEVSSNLYGEKELPTDTLNNISKLSWRELFKDTILQGLIEKGLENNIDLKTTQLKVEEAHQVARVAGAIAYLPSVSLTPQGTLAGTYVDAPSKTYNLAATVNWELDILTKVNERKNTKALYQQAKDYEQAVKTQLIAQIASTYYNLLMLDTQLSISEEMLSSAKKMLSSTKALMEAGTGTDVAVAQMEASCRSIEVSVLSLKEAINKTENLMSLLLAETPHRIERGKLEEQIFPDEVFVGVPLDILGNRPDVRMAEHALEAAFYATNKARASFYPSINLTGATGWTNTTGTEIFNPGEFLWKAVGTLTQPLFQKGQLVAKLKIAKAQQEEAKLAFHKSLLQAGIEVNEAMEKYQTSSQKAIALESQVKSMERAYRATSLLMDYGNTTYLEVLSAQQNYLSAQLTQVSNNVDRIDGIISLYQALGGGQE
ncbi:MAG TPA: multidrug transporter [Porphyromonadaceae bacterium]|nr:multidrug transporter [Porphyromonadaceae bacterium]